MDFANFGVRGAEFKNRRYTSVGWGIQPSFQDIKPRSADRDQHAILKPKAGETLVTKNVLCYFVPLS